VEYRLPNTPISYTPSPLWDWLVDWPSDYVNSELVWTKSAKANKWRGFILVAFDFVKSVKIGRLHGSKNFVGRTQKYVCLLHVPRVFKYTASITPPPLIFIISSHSWHIPADTTLCRCAIYLNSTSPQGGGRILCRLGSHLLLILTL